MPIIIFSSLTRVLDNFQIFGNFCYLLISQLHMVRECSLYDISYLKCFKTCFMDQYMINIYRCAIWHWEIIIECGVLHMSIRSRFFIVLFKTSVYLIFYTLRNVYWNITNDVSSIFIVLSIFTFYILRLLY